MPTPIDDKFQGRFYDLAAVNPLPWTSKGGYVLNAAGKVISWPGTKPAEALLPADAVEGLSYLLQQAVGPKVCRR